MKLSVFKKLIREVIREELDYSFSRLRKELNEIVVKSNTSNMNKARSKSTKDTSMKSLVKGKIEKDMFSKAWANAKTITPMIFS